MVPTLGSPPAMPSTLHCTPPLAFCRMAVNCWVAPVRTLAVVGLTATEGAGGGESPAPPMSVSIRIVNASRRASGAAGTEL